MDKELCFCIEEKELYLEQVLVDYRDIPIFFLCKNDKQYYVVLCTDINEYNYIVVQTPIFVVYNLLHGKVPMRNVFSREKEYWEIISGNEVAQDIVIKHSVDELNVALLPKEDAYYEVLTEEISAFVQKFDAEFWKTEHFSNIGLRGDLSEILINGAVDRLLPYIDKFVSLGDYSLKPSLEKQLILSTISYSEDMCNIAKKEKQIKNSIQAEKWRTDDLFNSIAA